MKVLLIRPPQIHWINEEKRLAQPIGLLNIAGYLRANGHDVYFIDAAAEGYNNDFEIKPNVFEYGLKDNQLAEKINEINPDAVGVHCSHTFLWGMAEKVAKLVKKINPNIITIVGGQHATGTVNEILDGTPGIDYVILGEGELQTLSLIDALGSKKIPLPDGIAYRNKNKKIIKPPERIISDLDVLSDPAFDLLKPELYSYKMSHFGMPRGQKFLTYTNARGCPTGCSYCTVSNYFGKKIRTFPIERVKKQLQAIVQLGFDEITEQSDNLYLFNGQYREAYLKTLKETNLFWNYDGGIDYSLCNKEFIDQLTKNGCYRVFLAIENIELQTMHNLHKYPQIKSPQEQLKKIKQVTKWLNDAGIEFYCAIMIGFPGESKKDIENAINWAEFLKYQLGAFAVTFHWAHPYPFTKFYNQAYHLVPPERKWQRAPEYYNFIKPIFPVRGLNYEEAERMVNEAFWKINNTHSRNTSYELKP